MGRKIDLLMRRQKVLEERVKETQGNNERLVEDFASQSEVIKRMAETHRNDRRLIGLLSEQVRASPTLPHARPLVFVCSNVYVCPYVPRFAGAVSEERP